MFLYLSDKIILSLPSFEMLSCNLDLTKTSYFGVGGIVTDDGENSRLMVCMETDCWIWKTSEWEPGPPIVENQKRYTSLCTLLIVISRLNLIICSLERMLHPPVMEMEDGW